jgi:hypothetical protein
MSMPMRRSRSRPAPRSDEDRPQHLGIRSTPWRHPTVRTAWLILGTGIALTSGAIQLIDSVRGRVVLWSVLAATTIFVAFSVAQSFWLRHKSRRGQEARRTSALEEALRTLSVRHISDYREAVSIRFVISDGTADRVIERRSTTPLPSVKFRMTGPFTDGHGRLDDLRATVDDGAGDIDLRILDLRTARRHVLTIFTPGRSERFDWTLSYATPGFWDPLRRSGTDRIGFYAGVLEHASRFSVERLTMTFLLPWQAIGVELTEELGRGDTTYRMTPAGEVEVEWTTTETYQRFGWTLTVDRWRTDD